MAENDKENLKKNTKEELEKKEMPEKEEGVSEIVDKNDARDQNKDASPEKTKKDSRKDVKGSPERISKRSTSEKAVSKVLVSNDDEITFVIEQLEEVKTKRVIVSVPEGSDLLVSSVGMKLLAKYADNSEKLVVVVTDDAAGRNMARLAGLPVAGAMVDVDDAVWSEAEALSRSREESEPAVGSEQEIAEPEYKGEPNGLVNKDIQDNIEEGVRLAEGGSEKEPSDQEEVEEDAKPMDLGRPKGAGAVAAGAAAGVVAGSASAAAAQASGSGTVAAGGTGVVSGAAASSESKVTSEKSMDRSDLEPSVKGGDSSSFRTVKSGSFEMTLDGGEGTGKPVGKVAAAPRAESSSSSGLIGRDFSGYDAPKGSVGTEADEIPERTSRSDDSKAKSGEGGLKNIPLVGALLGGGGGKFKKLVLPLVVVIALLGIGGYWYFSEVFVELEVESIPVEYSGEITALVNADDIDVDEGVIPARSEVVTNNGSDSAAATGVEIRGEKAQGSVNIYNRTADDISVAAGTVISNGGLGFVLQEDVLVPKRPDPVGMGSVLDVGVIAEDVGSEYNLESGTILTVGQLALSQMRATNPTPFSGGTSEEFSVVSQADIDELSNSIRKNLNKQSRDELSQKYNDTKWIFVGKSVKHELDGEVTSDVPAGAEQDSVNVDVKTKSTALYYDEEALDELIEELLMKDFGEEELEGVELSDDMEKNIKVKSASVADGSVVLKVEVSGFVMPKLDEDEIARNLYGKSWVEGVKYLKDVDYVSGDPDVTFYPEWLPEFTWRMPSRKGQITINLKNVVPEENSDEGSPVGEEADASQQGE